MPNPTPCSACRAPIRNPTPPTTHELLTKAWDFLTEANRVQKHPGSGRRPEHDITATLLLEHAEHRLFAWRDNLLLQHAYHLIAVQGPLLLPLLDLATDLARDYVDGAYTWEAPDPEEDDPETVIFFIAHALACLRWTLKWEPRIDLNSLSIADAQTFLNQQNAAEPIQLSLF